MSKVNKVIRNINKCRVCGSLDLQEVLLIPDVCYTGVFPKPGEKVQKSDMTLLLCKSTDCGLLQLKEVFDPDEMYGETYGYRSGLNQSMITHLRNHSVEISEKFEQGGNILDIGCNDGTFLKQLNSNDWNKFGIDPSCEKFAEYIENDIKFISDFFDASKLRLLTDELIDVVTSFSIFYDLEDPVSFAKDVKHVLSENGIWIFEQSYLGAMIATNSIDTICHEHVSYYSGLAIKKILKLAGLKILNIETNEVNGGSFVITAGHSHSDYGALENSHQIDQFLENEAKLRLTEIETFRDFKERLHAGTQSLIAFLDEAQKNGVQIFGIGASTKGNTYLQYFPEVAKKIQKIGEVNEDKYGKVTPGTNIPIVNEDEILSIPNAIFIVLPWHFRSFFLNAEKYREKHLIFALPSFENVIVK